jgi:hypothetical protein
MGEAGRTGDISHSDTANTLAAEEFFRLVQNGGAVGRLGLPGDTHTFMMTII